MDLPPINDGLATVTVAFIGAMVAALSWLGKSAVSGLVWYHGRRVREVELVAALVAKISTAVEALADYTGEDSARHIVEGLAGDPAYRIFIPLDRDYFVFDRVKADISLLPEAVILPVVRFYDEIGAFDVLVAEFQGARFEAFPVSRRQAYVTYMPATARSAAAAGRAALADLDTERRRLDERLALTRALIVGLVLFIALAVVAALVLAALIYLY